MSFRKIVCACLSACFCLFAESSGWEDNFDMLEAKHWQTVPPAATIALKDTLSAVNHVAVLSPAKGQQYFLSNDKFVHGDIEISFKVRDPKQGPQFYYLGFHANQPWTKAVCWLMIQDGVIFLHVKNPEGGKCHEQIGEVKPGFYHRASISQSTGKLVVTLDGKSMTFDDPQLLTAEPMPVFLGANTVNETAPAELCVEYVKVQGARKRSMFSEQPDDKTSKRFPPKLEADAGQAKFSWKIHGGFRWEAITHNGIPVSNSAVFSPAFAVLVDGKLLYSHELMLTGLQQSAGGFLATFSAPALPAIQLSLLGRLLDGNAISLQLQANNHDENEHNVQLVCPVTPSLVLPGQETETLHFFPWRGGLLGKATINIAAEYGGLAWQQLMFSATPKTHSGLLLYALDTTGDFKGLRLVRQQNQRCEILHSEAANRHLMPTLEPLGQEDGLAFCQYFAPRTLKKGEILRTSEIRLETFDGDWKYPMRQYSQFMRSNMRPVQVPRWFRDTYSIACKHPPFYYDAEAQKYTLASKLVNGEDAVQLAFWDDYKEYPKEQKVSQLQRYQPGDFRVNVARGGDRTFAEEIARTHANGPRVQLYIDHRFCWKETETAQKHAQDWATMKPNGQFYGYTSGDDLYLMCCYDQDKWSAYLADTCARLIKDLDIDSIYLDELGISFPCYNPRHSHTQANLTPVAPQELAKSLTMIRDKMQKQKPEAALMTEHAGSDYLTQFFDGSWDQTFYSRFDFVEKHFGRVCFFRFYFPHFKLAEWGPSEHHAKRNLFNGMGMDLGGSLDEDEQLLYCKNMKDNSDAFSSLSPEPLVPTSSPDLLANRFPAPHKTVYTLYNTSAQAITGRILETDDLLEKHVVELLGDNDITASEGQFNLDLPAESVAMLAFFTPAIAIANNAVNIIDGLAADIAIFEDNDQSTPKSKLSLRPGVHLNLPETSGKTIIKAFRNGYLVDEIILR